MGLIIGSELKKFQIGYPTVSDKYNAYGATLTGPANVEFGALLKKTSVVHRYEAFVATDTVAVSDIAGIALATNVKLASTYPAAAVVTMPGEVLSVLRSGNVAIKLDNTRSTVGDITVGGQVYFTKKGAKYCTEPRLAAGAKTLTVASYASKVLTIDETLTADDQAALVGRTIIVTHGTTSEAMTIASAAASTITVLAAPTMTPAEGDVISAGDVAALAINGRKALFTGLYENHGTTANPVYVAEIVLG